ncbi:MAG: GAF domain-containing SpoIIE family protein phosphatase, partial [bacterium]
GMIMLEEQGELKLKISWGLNEEIIRRLKYDNDSDIPSYCFQNQEPVILNNLNVKDITGILIDSIMCLPIQTSGTCYGIMLLINKSNGGEYSPENKETLEMLLNFVAVSIDNSHLVQEKLKRQKIEQEMAIARQIQETILPQNLDSITGSRIGAIYKPAQEVGGDFYQTHIIDNSKFLIVLGDVSNKGVPAALVMSAASGIIKSLIISQPNIPVNELAAKLNDLLSNEIIKDKEMFVTLFFAKFDLEYHRLTYCNGGHIPGLFWDSKNKVVCELPEGGPIVGQFPGVEFQKGERVLQKGDKLFLFTDGLTEAEDSKGNLLGRDRVEQIFADEIDREPQDFCVNVKRWVDEYTRGSSEDSHDDFTILQVGI